MVFHQRLFMKLQDSPPSAASCTPPLRGGVSLVQPTGSALIASSQEQSEWVTYHPTPSMFQPWLPTRRTVCQLPSPPAQTMFSVQSFLHRLSVVLGSGPDRTTSHFLIKTTLISFLAYYTECSLTKLFLYSRSLHYYFLYPFYISLTFTVVEMRYVDRLFCQ